MMRRAVFMVLAVAMLHACATARTATLAPPTEILGVRLDMPRAEVRELLGKSGKLEREERKRQEVWTVQDPRFASLIVGYDKNWNVRFVTGVAKPEGDAVKYADVLDVPAADHKSAGQTHTYTWTIAEPKYYVIAIGGPERLDYLSLKKDPTQQ
jgi:hypothetical protein